MYLCYVDESGVASIPGNTSHYVLCGLSIPIWHWVTCENQLSAIKCKYDLTSAEIHTGWIIRIYVEQNRVPNFENLTRPQRRYEVEKLRKTDLLRLQISTNRKGYLQTKKNYLKTEPYIHLTYKERIAFIREIAQTVSGWGFARLFAECIDKIHFDANRAPRPLEEQAFEQVVSRYERYLGNITPVAGQGVYGLLIHDNNPTVAKRHTELMKSFLTTGTFWTQLNHIIETPLFVDSELTSMVQIADLCAYALRRYLENNEADLFNSIFTRADRIGNTTVGVRHFTSIHCACKICASHRPTVLVTAP